MVSAGGNQPVVIPRLSSRAQTIKRYSTPVRIFGCLYQGTKKPRSRTCCWRLRPMMILKMLNAQKSAQTSNTSNGLKRGIVSFLPEKMLRTGVFAHRKLGGAEQN